MIIILLGAINQCNGHSSYTKYYKYYTRVPKGTLYFFDESKYHVLVDTTLIDILIRMLFEILDVLLDKESFNLRDSK